MNFQVTTKHMKICSAHNRHSRTVGLCELKKKFNIISHQGNENQNHSGTRGGLWTFTNGEVGTWRAMGRGGAGSDSGAHGRPLLTAPRRTDWRQGGESGTKYR